MCTFEDEEDNNTQNEENMSFIKDQIDEFVYESTEMLKNYTKELESYANGSLACCKNTGKDTFYRTYTESGRYIRTSISRNPEMIKELARKEYLEQAIKALNNNIKVLTRAGEGLRPLDLASLRASMTKAYGKLPDDYFHGEDLSGRRIYLSDDYSEGIKRHEAWGREAYEKSTYMPEQLKIPTTGGFKVRSKSELYIVEKLLDYGVPFHYEEVIWLNGREFAPDLTFRDRRMLPFYWEHAGMMDLPSYQSHHKWKMNMYEKAGIVPWQNLIITYDEDGVINAPLINSIIENDVLPRL